MIIKLERNKILQYISLYGLLLLCGSKVWVITQKRETTITLAIEVIVISIGVLMTLRPTMKKNHARDFLFLALIAIIVIFVRIRSGGAGISVLLEWGLYIFCVRITLEIDVNNFLDRYIWIIYVFAIISLIGFAIQIISPDLIKTIFVRYDSNFSEYAGWVNGQATYNAQSAWGKFLFTMDERHSTKNLGIYSEPGCYQIVLNSALYVILFMKDFISLDERKINRITIVLIVAIITCQSTTGYLSLGILLICYLFDSKREGTSQRGRIGFSISIVLVLLGLDYILNGTDSLLGSVIFSKLFGSGTSIDLSGGTGIYRIGSIFSSIVSMIQHPLGVGYDEIYTLIQTNLSGSAGAILIVTGAALGIPALIVFIWWTISPIVGSHDISRIAKVAFILIWLNTSLAQSEEIYTGIIFIPMILLECPRKSEAKDVNSLKEELYVGEQ